MRMQLLYVVSAAILGSEAARRIFHVESIIQDPNVQELIREWEDKGRDKGRAEEARRALRTVLAARSLSITSTVRARIEREPDLARLESWIEAAATARAIGDVFGLAERTTRTARTAPRAPARTRTRTRSTRRVARRP